MPTQEIPMGMLGSVQRNSDFDILTLHEAGSGDRIIEDAIETNAEITLRDGIRKVIGYDVVNRRLNHLELERTATKLNVISRLDDARTRIEKLESDKKGLQDEVAELKRSIVEICKQNVEHKATVEDLQSQIKGILAQLALNGTNSSAGDSTTPEHQVGEFDNIKTGQVGKLQGCWEQVAELRKALDEKGKELINERRYRSLEAKKSARLSHEVATLEQSNTQLLKQNSIPRKLWSSESSDDGRRRPATDGNQPLECSDSHDTLDPPNPQFQEEKKLPCTSQNEALASFFAGLMRRSGGPREEQNPLEQVGSPSKETDLHISLP
ncbi:hypothetical protein DL98DRAFT_144252 [Cadophora sp. DSE1049]|nr:hypothetical protein DL98DRAFT_144252 [Cadophora sp. DSE1049]